MTILSQKLTRLREAVREGGSDGNCPSITTLPCSSKTNLWLQGLVRYLIVCNFTTVLDSIRVVINRTRCVNSYQRLTNASSELKKLSKTRSHVLLYCVVDFR